MTLREWGQERASTGFRQRVDCEKLEARRVETYRAETGREKTEGERKETERGNRLREETEERGNRGREETDRWREETEGKMIRRDIVRESRQRDTEGVEAESERHIKELDKVIVASGDCSYAGKHKVTA